MRVILDSNIYALTDIQSVEDMEIYKHYTYLEMLINFFKYNNLKGTVMCSLKEYEAISNMEEHPWSQYSFNNKNVSSFTILPILFKDFLQLINYDELKENLLLPAIPKFIMQYSTQNNCLCHNEFLKHISEIDVASEYMVFMGIGNQHLETPLFFIRNELKCDDELAIDPIMDINDGFSMSFSGSFRNFLLSNRIANPNVNNPFPNADICKQYVQIRNKLIKEKNDKISTYLKIFREVALRNGYQENLHLSHLNSSDSQIREIYSSTNTPTVHICADVRHGTIEVCNYLGKHQGEYTYSGEYIENSKDKTGKHDIKV